MDDLSTTAAAPSAPAASSPAPASSSTPAATPSTPSPTPSATPAAEPAASPTPAAPQPNADTLREMVKTAAENAEKELLAAKQQPLTPEAPKAEPAKPAETAAEPPKTETAKSAEAAATEPNPLDKLGPLPAEKLVAAFKEAPAEVQEWAKKNNLDVDTLAETARMAAQTGQYQELYPTVEAAKTAYDGFQTFARLDEKFVGIKSPQDYDGFMGELVELSLERDEKGQPIPDPANPGAYKNDGSVARFVKMNTDVELANIESLASQYLQQASTDEEKAYAEDLIGAAKFLNEFRNAGYHKPGQPTDAKTLPPDVQARLAEADRVLSTQQERDAQAATQAYETTENKIVDMTEERLSPLITDILDKTALPDELKQVIVKEAWEQVSKRVNANPLFKQQRDGLSPRAGDYLDRRVATNLTYMKPILVKAVQNLVGKLAGPIVKANQDLHAKIDTQKEATRMEPTSGASTVQAHPTQLSSDDISSKALQAARAAYGPNVQAGSKEHFAEIGKLKKLPIYA